MTITFYSDTKGLAAGLMKVYGLALPVKHYYVSMNLKEEVLGLV